MPILLNSSSSSVHLEKVPRTHPLVDDSVLFMGDSIVFFAFDRNPARLPGYSEDVLALAPWATPRYADAGVAGAKSADGVAIINTLLADNPGYHYVALAYGTNDCFHDVPLATFQANMESMINTVLAAGRIPVVPRIYYATAPEMSDLPQYNAIVDSLQALPGVETGPDMYQWFFDNQAQLSGDGLHPTNTGYIAINQQWAEAAMDFIYGV